MSAAHAAAAVNAASAVEVTSAATASAASAAASPSAPPVLAARTSEALPAAVPATHRTAPKVCAPDNAPSHRAKADSPRPPAQPPEPVGAAPATNALPTRGALLKPAAEQGAAKKGCPLDDLAELLPGEFASEEEIDYLEQSSAGHNPEAEHLPPWPRDTIEEFPSGEELPPREEIGDHDRD